MKDGYLNPQFSVPIESQTKYNKTLTEIDTEIFTKSLLVEPELFDKTYDELVKKYLKSGGQEVIDEKKENYNKYIKGQ